MRTTLDLPDHLMVVAKQKAAADHTSLREVVAEALARYLLATPADPAPTPWRFPTLPGKGGMFPGIDPTDTSALLEIE